MPGRSSSNRRSAKRPSRLEWLRGAPPWLSAVAAVTGTLIAAIGVFGLIGAPPAPTPTVPPPTALAPRVTIESLLVDGQQVEAQGLFEFVDPLSQEVLFIGRPAADTTDLWVAVEAALRPNAQLGQLQSGEWSASRPSPPVAPYRWRAIVWPSASGATGNEDLQVNGPDSRYVISSSEEWLEQ